VSAFITWSPSHQQHHLPIMSDATGAVKFNGSNWQALNRVIATSRFHFLIDDDCDTATRQCAYLALQYEGPALDWVAQACATDPEVFKHFERFIDATREAFGIADNNIIALLRRDLDQLRWSSDVPVFFAEFDRLTHSLGITSHETRVAMVEGKLPVQMKIRLAEQALSFSNYDTMRERFNCMWALDPSRGQATASRGRKTSCANCGRKGHQAPECRGSKK